MNRRQFLKSSASIAGAYAFGSRQTAAGLVAKSASDRIALGNFGVKASRLALGTGTHGGGGHSNQTRLGLGGVADLFKAAHDNGVNFWDSADQYGSHPHLKEALKSVAREKVVILTKTHASTAAE